MANEIGKRYVCKKCNSEFIVTKAGSGALVCCGQPMEIKKQCCHSKAPNNIAQQGDSHMNQLGKRYKCSVCNTEVLCTKAGDGSIMCCDKEMEMQEPRPLPSSD